MNSSLSHKSRAPLRSRLSRGVVCGKYRALFKRDLPDSPTRCHHLAEMSRIHCRAVTAASMMCKDGLVGKHGKDEMVLTNPPFGKKSSVTIVNEAGDEEKQSLVVHRDNFWASTSNKQLNFLQHVFTILKQHGRAAIVVPDNVLFEGGAGETVRRELLKQSRRAYL